MSTPVIDSAAGQGVEDLGLQLTQHRRRTGDILFKLALQACLFIGFAFLAWLVAYAVYRGWNRLDSRLWELQPTGRTSRIDRSGVQSAIMGTIWVITLTAIMCMPTGILGAIYLEEYADNTKWYNRLLELNIQNLAGVPSIIFGILGLGLVARTFGLGFGVITGAIILALLVLPVVIIATREALRSVPQSIRHASYALGATKWQTISRQVLPAAVPGIATGSILALSRAIGEAAPLLLLGAALVSFNPEGLTDRFTTLPTLIFALITRSQSGYQEIAAAAIVLLLGILLIMNSIAIFVRNKFQKRW